MKHSVAEWNTVDEQNEFIVLATPVMTQGRFAQLTGLTEGQVRGMVDRGHLPTLKIGRMRLVNMAALSQDALYKEGWNEQATATGSI